MIMIFGILRQDQVNLLLYRLNQPHFKQKQKNDITKFSPTDFFSLLSSAF